MPGDRLSYLKDFQELQQDLPGPVPHSIHFDFKQHSSHAVINAIMHGDEYGSLPAIIKVIRDLQSGALSYGGLVTFTLGNVEAYKQDQRFIEQDLNREFYDFDGSSLEKHRAQELSTVIQNADFFLDLHQTIEPTQEAFYLFKDLPQNFNIAERLGVASYAITSKAGESVNTGKKTGIEYATDHNIPAVLIELSQKGFNAGAEDKTYTAIANTLHLLENKESCPTHKFKELQITHKEPFDSPHKALNPGFTNFHQVKTGEVIGVLQDGAPLEAPQDGFLLFPKYPKRDDSGKAHGNLPTDIFLLASKKL